MLRTYDAEQDGLAIFDLYQACFHDTWPLRAEAFHAIISQHSDYRAGDHFVAEKEGQIVGFVATQLRRTADKLPSGGGISLLMVHPDWRRQGIGRQLNAQAISHLKQFDLAQLVISTGNSHHFWQGIPDNLSDAQTFFQKCGWSVAERSDDLVGNVDQLKRFAEATQQRSLPHITFRLAESSDAQAILDFEECEFPHWKPYYQNVLEENRPEGILVACSQDDEADKSEPIAMLLLEEWQSPQFQKNYPWHEQLGEKLGALAAVGVAEEWNDQGIGSALVARGAEILKTRDVEHIYIYWTGRTRFYERLGYELWQGYSHMVYEI